MQHVWAGSMSFTDTTNGRLSMHLQEMYVHKILCLADASQGIHDVRGIDKQRRSAHCMSDHRVGKLPPNLHVPAPQVPVAPEVFGRVAAGDAGGCDGLLGAAGGGLNVADGVSGVS